MAIRSLEIVFAFGKIIVFLRNKHSVQILSFTKILYDFSIEWYSPWVFPQFYDI